MKLKKMFRAIGAVDAKVDPETRTVSFSFSSEYPVERFFGKEILSHAPGAADLSRLNSGGALLWNHNTDQMVGVIDSANVQDGKGMCTARFSRSAQGQQLMQDVMDGICRNVSFAYQIKEMQPMNPGVSNQEPEFMATSWMPYEVSFVSIPADPTVGVGRADDGEEHEVTILGEAKRDLEQPMGAPKMDPKELAVLEAKIGAESREAERARIASISVLGEKFKDKELARQLVEKGTSLEEARAAFCEKMGMKQVPVSVTEGEIGLSEKEVKEFSFVRAINALANPHDAKLQEAAKFERACSLAAEKVSGKNSRGIMVPTEVLRHGAKRDMTAGSNSGGGYAVATELLGGSFIDLLRNRMVTQRLGATSLNGLQGNISIPKLTGGATSYWVAENSAPTEGAETLGQVAMSPKTVGAYVDISRRLMIQSSIDFESMVKGDLAKSIGLAIDAKALYGDGSSNTITGVRYASSLNTVDFAGSDPTWLELVDMEAQVAADNADVGTLAYAFNALARGKLKGIFTNATYGEIPVFSGGQVNGYRAEVSNQVSKLSTADYDYFFGNWADLMIGFWSGLDLLVDPYTGSSAGTVRVVAFQDVDCAVRHGESFCYGNKTIV